MNAAGDSFNPDDFLRITRGEWALWLAASVIVLATAGTGVWAYQRFAPQGEPAGEPAGAMTVEYAEFVTSPAEEEFDIAEGDPAAASAAAPQTEAEPVEDAEPVEPIEDPVAEEQPPEAPPPVAVEPPPEAEEPPPKADEPEPAVEEPPPEEVVEPEPVARLAAIEPERVSEPEPVPVETAEPVIDVPEVDVPEPAVVIERQAEVEPAAEPVEEPPVVEPEPEPEPEPVDPNMPMPVVMPQRIADIRAETPATKFTPPPERKAAPPPSAASVAAAPKPAAEKAEQVAAPQQAVSAEPSASQVSSWQNSVLRHLARRQRNPNDGRRGQGGVVVLRFSIDAGGRVQSVSIAQSSGVPALDQAATELAWSSSPVPTPPAGQEKLPIVIPLEYRGTR